MPETPTPLDLDAIRARADATTPGPWEDFLLLSESGKRKRYEVTPASDYEHEVAQLSLAHEADAAFIAHARTDVPALVTEVERLRAENTRLRAICAGPQRRLTAEDLEGLATSMLAANPAPAWDENASIETFKAAWHKADSEGRAGERVRDGLGAAVREHLPTKPDREAVVQDVTTDVMDALGFHPQDAGRDDVAAVIRSHPDLWPGRSEAEVKAEALRDAADEWHAEHYGTRPAAYKFLWDRADRLATEGGDDRG